ncbi:MAG: single-stranded DNA-binding protein [Planctomycetes bacterium]|nr:single-stranded DNA-binding protein [Planctomycetota bacterium]
MSLTNVIAGVVPKLDGMSFSPPVACVYDPLDYAWDMHRQYLDRFGRGRKQVLLLGMNPGPFGMVQTGVPFGEVEAVRSWLGLRGVVRRPANEHHKRPIEGLQSTRSEVSGRRLWSWAAQRFVTPMRFFRRFFVHNYCPLAFLTESGANLTPDKLKKTESEPLFALCDGLLRDVVEVLRPDWVVGIGAFAEQRITRVFAVELQRGELRCGRIPHPSPASPVANKGWEQLADRAFGDLGIAV